MGLSHMLFVTLDCILTGAIGYAYFPQIRRLRDVAMNGVPPSMDGLSPYYLLFHAMYTSSLLSRAIISAGNAYLGAKGINAFAIMMSGLPVLMLWLCAGLMIILFALGYTKSPGKKLVPVLAAIYAVIFVFVVADLTAPPQDLGDMLLGGMAGMIVGCVMPVFVVLQAYFQYCEMINAESWQALSLRSFRLQVLVAGALAIQWFVETPWPEDFFHGILTWTLGSYTIWSPTFNSLLWIGGAVLVYTKAMENGGDKADKDVESGIALE